MYAEFQYILSVIMLSVTTLSVVMLGVVMPTFAVSVSNARAFFHRKRQFQSMEVLRFLCKKEGSTFVPVL